MSITVNKIITNNNILSGSSSDLVTSKNMIRNFGATEDYVELDISDPSGKHLFTILPFLNYKVPGTLAPTNTYNIQELEFDPALDLQNLGVAYGDYVLTYNILRPKIVKSYDLSFFIKEISPDRTEIRLNSNNIPNIEIENNTLDFIYEFQNQPYFKEFYINFGKGQLIPAINVALDRNLSQSSILIKLLNPLPLQYTINNLVGIVDEISNPQSFSVSLDIDPVITTYPTLRGPNFDLDLDNLRVGPTPYYNFTEITTFSGSFNPQLQQLLGQLSASNFSINVDYTDYEDFVHYSSAARRLEGFQYKLTNIELFTSASASAAISANPNSQLDAILYQNKVNSTIQSFDGWENYLYFESSSYSWPKQNSTKPYSNYSITSSQAQIWYSGNYNSASLYDDNNQNYLLYTLPGYIAENDSNDLAFKFVASIGQMFDDVWIHIKAITDLYQAKNALSQGISKDLVYFALQSMGINTYTDQDGKNQFQYLYGVDENGNYLPPTSSYETLVTASQYQLPGQDQQKGIYKRLYHNLPLLLKSKGTTRFIQYLNTIFGIPDTIMSYVEYGGADKITSSFEYEYDRYTYAIQLSGSNEIQAPWEYLNQNIIKQGYNDIVANGIELRFKVSPSSSVYSLLENPTQSIFYQYTDDFSLNLIYTQTGSSDSIYSGSIGNFGYFEFKLINSQITSSTLPIFETGSNGETSWYNVLVQRRYPNKRIGDVNDPQYYDIYVKNNIWGEIGHTTSASLYVTDPNDNTGWYIDGGNIILGGGDYRFSGSYQELRLWSNYLSESAFNSHVLNPESIEGNYVSSSYDDLAGRWPLGNDLYTYNHAFTSSINSVHPEQSVSINPLVFAKFPNRNNYSPFTELYYADVANSGYANPVVDKIRIYSGSEYGTQLMPNKSIEVPPLVPITKDIHLLDASLSPMDEIDRDIIAQLGSTYDLDNIIGNPATGSYQELEVLRNEYFKKYINKYNYKDYVRLIEFFHNSLFRTLKDFTPARTNPSTGILYKPHLLERSLALRPEPYVTDFNNDSASINTAFISASNGGGYSQSIYPITYQVPNGYVTLDSDARDFFTGELPSASIDYHSIFKTLNYNPFTQIHSGFTSNYSSSIWNYSYNALLNNVSGSRLSSIRQKINYENSGSKIIEVLEPFAIQDFTYDYFRHARPRYIGSKTISSQYNFYTDNDYKFDESGNGAYSRNATIDKNTIQFAYFATAVATGSQILASRERTNLYLKYLIDATGSLNELTEQNYSEIRDNQFWNLYQVQNIFRQGDTINVSLFDNQIPSKQKNLEGNKIVLSSGIKYYPTLWRQNNVSNLRYYIPQGYSNAAYLDLYNWLAYNITTRFIIGWQGITTVIEGYVKYNPSGGPSGYLPYDIIVTVKINVLNLASSYVDILVPRVKPDGSPNYMGYFRHDRGGHIIVQGASVIGVKPASGVDSVNYEIADSGSWLNVDQGDQRWVSCSATLSNLYSTEFYFTGSDSVSYIINKYTGSIPPELPFELNPGDIVRFDSGSSDTGKETEFFKAVNEYTIMEVKFPPSSNVVVFKLDRPVDNTLTSSNAPGRIDRYIFSRKITDETNIIIAHQKNPGATSGGVIKNSNLLLSIENKSADIISDLKNKIFSTVLTT